MKVVKVVFSGRVQNVGFRQFVKDRAKELGLVGYVKNNKDGTVELVVKGNASKIEKLFDFLQSGFEITNLVWIDDYEDNSSLFRKDFIIKF